MKRFLGASVTLVMIVGVLVATMGSASAAVATPGVNYTTAAGPSSQCSLPVSARTGGWECLATNRPAATPNVAASTPRSEYCNGWGCWSVYSDFFAEFYGTTIYLGYGGSTIAQVTFLAEWNLQGAQSLANPVQSTVSAYTVHTIFSGALYNGADGVANGGQVKSTCSPNTRPAAAAGQLVSYPNGCKLYDNTSYDHNQVVQGSWTFSNYPGYWYFYVRSPVSHAPDKSIFRFHNASDLSGSSSVGGWNS